MNDKIKKDPGVIHVKVTVSKKTDGSFHDEFDPKTIKVTESDTILAFRLTSKTPDDIIISSITVNPEDQDQLSTPSISRNGKQATLSDINTAADNFSLTFHYRTKGAQHVAMAAARSGEPQVMEQYPEIENIPP
jgi:hypothetical protein